MAALTAAGPEIKDDPGDLWWPMVEEVDTYTAVSEEGRLELEVRLARPGEEELAAVTQHGSVVGYSLRGRPLIGGFVPGTTVIAAFDLRWEGQPIAIPERFWNDLAGFRLQTLSVEMDTLDADQRARAQATLAELDRPRIVLSADEGTALIEWDRLEKGGLRSTCRWVVSRGGTVLRHRHRSSLLT